MNRRTLGVLGGVLFTLGLGCTMDNPAFDELARRETEAKDTLADESESDASDSEPPLTTTDSTTSPGDGDGDGDGDMESSEATTESESSTTGDGDGDPDTGGDGDGDALSSCEGLGLLDCQSSVECKTVRYEDYLDIGAGALCLEEQLVYEACIPKDECVPFVEGDDPWFWCNPEQETWIGLVDCMPWVIEDLNLMECPPPAAPVAVCP